MQLISQIRQIYDNYGMETEILVASIRHPQHVVESALMGADCSTIPPKVLWQLAKHPLTDQGIEAFSRIGKRWGRSFEPENEKNDPPD